MPIDLNMLANAVDSCRAAVDLAGRLTMRLAGAGADVAELTADLRATLDALENFADSAQDALSGIEQEAGLVADDGSRKDGREHVAYPIGRA